MTSHATGQSVNAENAGTDHLIPSGHSSNPSRWSKRIPLAVLAGIGCLVAVYLALYQAGAIDSVWEPFFGDGSVTILNSSLARSLPVPDAALGALAYLCEVVLDLIGGENRWHSLPYVVIAFGLLVLGMAIGSIGLVLLQAFYFNAFCTFCLVSAVISLIIVGPALEEPLASIAWVRQQRAERM